MERFPERTGAPRVPRLGVTALVVGVALAAWTIVILITPSLRFDALSPRTRVPLETLGGIAAALVAILAYLRWALTRFRGWIYVSTSFAILAVSQWIFGVVLASRQFGALIDLHFYQWSAARFATGILLVIGARSSFEHALEGNRPSAFRSLMIVAIPSFLILAVVELGLWFSRGHLPEVTRGTGLPRGFSLQSLTLVDILLGFFGLGLFFFAAWQLRRVNDYGALVPWLTVALIIAAFSHLHYMLLPTVFTNRFSTGDLLRVGVSAVLLLGFLWEITRSQRVELAQSRRLVAAYEMERAHVADLENLDRTRAEMFGLLTHELMHPVSSVRGFAATLLRRWDDLPDDQRYAVVERIERETIHLRDLAEEAVTILHLDFEPFEMLVRPESATEVVRDASDMVEELNGRLKVKVDDGSERSVMMGDRARVLQVLRNLLSNAAKYSPPDTPIELRLGASNGTVVFSVSDQGRGIAQEDIGRLFKRFSRIQHDGEGWLPGSGLGLYICRRIVEAHGGRIWVESTPQKGSTFAFSIPKAPTT
jgi:signal transduction histidine kinase